MEIPDLSALETDGRTAEPVLPEELAIRGMARSRWTGHTFAAVPTLYPYMARNTDPNDPIRVNIKLARMPEVLRNARITATPETD